MTWKAVTGDDGREYFEVTGTFALPPGAIEGQGVVMMAPAPTGTVGGIPVVVDDGAPRGGYTLTDLQAMRNAMWVDSSRWTLYQSPGVRQPEPEPPTGRFQNLDWEEAS